MTSQTIFFSWKSCDFLSPLVNEVFVLSGQHLPNPDHFCFFGTIGIETKSSTYGLPGKWWDLTKFPRKLSTIAPAPVKVDAWSGLQTEQLSNLGRSCYPVSNWRTRIIFAFGNNWHWDKKQYLWTTWQVVGSYKISPKTVDYRTSSSKSWCLIRSANRTTE